MNSREIDECRIFQRVHVRRLPGRIRGMFNLNDPRWGAATTPTRTNLRARTIGAPRRPAAARPATPRGNGSNQGRPIWTSCGATSTASWAACWAAGGNGGGGGAAGGTARRRLPARHEERRHGRGPDCGVAVLIWLGTGFFIVQEGQQAVITQFGKYKSTVGAGFNWRLPYPIQRHELVFVTQIRSVDVGRDNVIKSTGLRESAMLTEDENIVEIKFAVQYRLSDARAWFESKNPARPWCRWPRPRCAKSSAR
jgi:membrane protease subunit HflK